MKSKCSWIVGAVAFVLFVSFPATPDAAASFRILMLGDSLTHGYGLPPGMDIPSQLQAKLRASGTDVRVINAGVSGDTSASGLARLDWSLTDHPNAAIVELGSNDALRGIPPAQTESNLSAVMAKLKAQRIPTLLLGMKAPRNLGPEYTRSFDAIYPKLAEKYGATLYPFVLQGVVLDPKLNQRDGMHPNAEGAKIITDRLYPDVKALVHRAMAKAR